MQWDPPGPGQWYLTREHFPRPVSRLFTALFPTTTRGWQTATLRYGMPERVPRWIAVNNWLYYGPAEASPGDDATAAHALATTPWTNEIEEWHRSDCTRVISANRCLQSEDLAALDDEGLAGHLRRAMDHFLDVGQIHFELHVALSVSAGFAMRTLERWDLTLDDVAESLAGGSPASARAQAHIDRIAAALGHSSIELLSSLDDIRRAGPEAAAALDSYLDEYGWRGLDQHELRGATLGELPDVLIASVRARAAAAPYAWEGGRIRDRIPLGERDEFDALVAQFRTAYGVNDDNVGITWGWPLGLVRRATLEAGQRLVAAGKVHERDHVFETEPDELIALLTRTPNQPPASELATRDRAYRDAATADAPAVLGEWDPAVASAGPPAGPAVERLVDAERALWPSAMGAGAGANAEPNSSSVRGTGVNTGVYRGRACVVDGDGYLELEPGDVIVATVTHAGHNTVFPIAGAVATEHGGLISHPAVLARELGLPAVVGASGLLALVKTGDTVEVDASAGVVRVIS